MKSKKIAAIVAIAITGTYIVPTNAIAKEITSNKVVLVKNSQNKTSALKNDGDDNEKGSENNTNEENQSNSGSQSSNITQSANGNQSGENNGQSTTNVANQSSENNGQNITNVANQSNEKSGQAKNTENQNLSVTNNLSTTNIKFYNIWGGATAEVGFNTSTMKMQAKALSGDIGNGNNNYMNFVYYNSKTGKVSETAVNDGSSSNLTNLLNNKSFNYGDVIGIQFQEGTDAPKLSNGNEISQNGQMEYFEITPNGLVNYTPKVSVNPLQIITGSTVTEGTVTGTGAPNEKVTAEVNGQTFTGETNSNGEFSLNISDSNGFSESSKITLEIPSKVGVITKVISPTLATGININKNQIVLNNCWNQNIGTIGFNPANETMEFQNGWSSTNPYLSSSDEAFGISLYNSNGSLIKSINVNGDEYPQNALSKFLNNQPYQYGEYIEIDYKTSSNISITNFQGNGAYKVTKPTVLQITKSGLKQGNITAVNVNPVDILQGAMEVTKGTITGKVNPNEVVTATINGKNFTGKSDSEGNYSIEISDSSGFTANTKIELNANGYLPNTVSPITSTGLQIQNSAVQIDNGWNDPAGLIKFNPYTMQLEVSQYNAYLGHNSNNFLNISVYDPKTGNDVYSASLDGNDNTTDLANALSKKTFSYGDILNISYDSTQGSVKVSNGSKNIGNSNGNNESFEITEGGLVKSTIAPVQVNPLAILDGTTKVTEGTLTGKANPNEVVTATVNRKTFEGKSDSKGNYSINLSDSNGFTAVTNIEVKANGYLPKNIMPTLENNISIQNTTISFSNNWNDIIGTIGFNANTQRLTFNSGSAGTNPYVYPEDPDFTVSVYNPQGQIEGSVTAYGNSYPQKELSNLINNKTYQYGSYIKVTYQESTNIIINKFNNQNNYKVTGTTIAKITKNGLVPVNMQDIKVNPFDILTGGTVKSGNVTGTAPAGAEVTATVNGKTFTGKANSKGEFSINVSDENGFTNSTTVTLWTPGELGVQINPVIPTNWGINGTELQLPNSTLGIAQTLKFNPNTMKITNLGNAFAAQLIDGTTGKVVASVANNNFNVFKSKNNLNGATFKYGDIINIYESKETYLSDGVINLYNQGKKTSISPINKFQSFEITKNGLVPIANKNLTNATALYNGNNQVVISGKTTANTNVSIFYGNNEDKVVKSNGEGEFSLTLPLDDANIGSEARIFVNNQNAVSTVVAFNPKKYNVDNSIQIENNESVPVINITFSPITKTIKSMVYPIYKTYAGVFYGNQITMSLLNGKTGAVMKTVTSNKPQEIQSFSNQLNGVSYNNGEIIKIQYNSNLLGVNVSNSNKEIGNKTGNAEYFEITNEGLVNVTNKFVTVNPLDILGNGNVTKATLTGTVGANETVTADVDGKDYTGKSDSKGNFSLNIEDSKGFSSDTSISVSANGYLPTTIKPTTDSNIALSNSYVNFYQNTINWETTGLSSSIGFNTNNNTFVVNNYESNFGTGDSNYFTFNLYNPEGTKILGQSFNGSSTAALSTFLNGKSFNYGDVIELNFNPSKYKPVIINGNNAYGNLTGNKEYFEITKSGLKEVSFGNNALVNSTNWNNGNLTVTGQLTLGNSSEVENGAKKILLLNSNGDVVASENATTSEKNGATLITGTLTVNDLSKIKSDENYTIAFESGNTIISIYSNVNMDPSSKYILTGNSEEQLGISEKLSSYTNIKSSADIASYSKQLGSDVNKLTTNSLTNPSNANKLLANTFINRIGLSNLETFYNKSSQNAEFLNWVLNNSTAMEEFLSGPNPDGANIPEGQPRATYTESLQVWSNIWNTYTNSHTGFNLKLAIAVALTNGQPILSFPAGTPVGSPVQRYNIFEQLNAENGMMPGFNKLDVSHLCYVVNTDIANNQIEEMRSIILQNHNGLITPSELENIAYTINYNTRNPYTGASVFGNNFYGPNPTIKDVWYDGGVCGATGRMGEAAEQVFGVPAAQTPQPGHNAFIYYDYLNNSWIQGNNLEGWNQTYDADLSGWSDILSPNDNEVASYTVLYQAADNQGNLQKSNMYLYLAQSQTGYENKLSSIKEAISTDKLNLGAWIELANLYHSNPNITTEQYSELANDITTTFANYTMPMTNMVHYLYSNKLQSAINNGKSDIASLNYTNVGKKALNTAITNGETVLGNVNDNESTILKAINEINTAINTLQGNKSVLNGYITKAKELIGDSDYTTSSIDALQNAVNNAEKVTENNNSTASEINSAINNIKSSILNLTVKNIYSKAELQSQLKMDINSANNALGNLGYTLGSKNNLSFAITNGNSVLSNQNATPNEIEAAINDLQVAYKKLVVNKPELQEDINLATEAVNNNQYTSESKIPLEKAIKEAKTILNSGNINAFAVENSIVELNTAFEGLVTKTPSK